MSKIKKFLSLTLFLIRVLSGAFLLTHFSVAQSYSPLINSNLFGRILKFAMPDNPVYLYAIAEPNNYTIHFNGNGSTSWSMISMNMVYDIKANLSPNNFTRDWYIFKWRSSSETWTVDYLDQAEVRNLTPIDSGEIILYAQREGEVPFTIAYYQENVAWTWYDLVETSTGYAIPGPRTILTGNTYTWFTLQTGTEVSIVSGWTVPYYYTRNSYNLVVKDRDETLIDTWVKYWADIPLPSDPERTWNIFSWWDNLPGDGKMPADNLVITSAWTYGAHTITFDTDWWTEINPITKDYWDAIGRPQNPTREWYEFVWWSPDIPDTMPYDDIVVTAIWKEIINKWTWYSGRWRTEWTTTSDTPKWWDDHWTLDDNIPKIQRDDLEILAAYMRAYRKWIIWTGWWESDPDGYVTRWDMAEMVVKFTENVLWRKIPSTPARCKWWDAERDRKSPETKVYAQKACALWVMWIRMQDFLPNKILDRAEFGTILSRLLWWDKYDVVNATKTNLYYTRHLNALNKAWIMKQIDNPEDRKELRKRAWIMLMRVRE